MRNLQEFMGVAINLSDGDTAVLQWSSWSYGFVACSIIVSIPHSMIMVILWEQQSTSTPLDKLLELSIQP